MPRPPLLRVDVRAPTIPLAKPAAIQPHLEAPDELLTRSSSALATFEADRAARIADAARGLSVAAPTFQLAPGLRRAGDTVIVDLDVAGSAVYAQRIQKLSRHRDGHSYMLLSNKGCSASTVADLDPSRAAGIYVASFVVSTNYTVLTAEGYARTSAESLTTPVEIKGDLGVFAFHLEHAAPSIEVGLWFTGQPSDAMIVFRRGEVTKLK